MSTSPSSGCECSIEQGFFHWERRAVGADMAVESKDEDNRKRNTDGSETKEDNGQGPVNTQTHAHMHTHTNKDGTASTPAEVRAGDRPQEVSEPLGRAPSAGTAAGHRPLTGRQRRPEQSLRQFTRHDRSRTAPPP